jgi:hypothetical protein
VLITSPIRWRVDIFTVGGLSSKITSSTRSSKELLRVKS